MRLLIVSATEQEVAPLVKEMRFYGELKPRLKSYEINGKSVDVLTSGVGMTATAARVAKTLAEEKYLAAINVGICGSFDRSIPLGSVVRVTEDCFPELGAEDGFNFLTIEELNLVDPNETPYSNGKVTMKSADVFALLHPFKSCSGITVNRVLGSDSSIAEVVKRWNPQVESMEGAGFYYACGLFGIPSLQLRAVSNYVERRNRESWKIKEAVANLNNTLLNFLRS